MKPSYELPNMGLINSEHYCEEADQFNLENPENILNNMNFITDYNADGLAR